MASRLALKRSEHHHIHVLFYRLAGLEIGYTPLRNSDTFTASGISPHTWNQAVYRKTAKSFGAHGN